MAEKIRLSAFFYYIIGTKIRSLLHYTKKTVLLWENSAETIRELLTELQSYIMMI